MFPIAILAGGLATRLRPLTEEIPKSLIEVAGRPFIDHQLEYISRQGIGLVVLCIGYMGEMIQDFVGNGSQWNLSVRYSTDGPSLLGTGGALRRALPLLGENFFILYGDSYLPINIPEVQKAYISSGKCGLMTLVKNQNQWDSSNVEFSAGKIIEYNKKLTNPQMQYIDYGLSLLQGAVIQAYPADTAFDLADVYNRLSMDGELAGFEVFERFYEIGSREGIVEAQSYLLQRMTRNL